jgi:hypothetical protein
MDARAGRRSWRQWEGWWGEKTVLDGNGRRFDELETTQ